VHCCLPCPKTDWLYPDNFNTVTTAVSWLNVAAITCVVFLLLSWAVLPVGKTHRHYLNVCLAVAVGFMQVCYHITPPRPLAKGLIVGVHHPPRGEATAVRGCDHAQRHGQQSSVRPLRGLFDRRRLGRRAVGVLESAVASRPDMLAGRGGQNLYDDQFRCAAFERLLTWSSSHVGRLHSRLGHSGHRVGYISCLQWSFLPVWR
jgi:hypothetical protein